LPRWPLTSRLAAANWTIEAWVAPGNVDYANSADSAIVRRNVGGDNFVLGSG